MHLRSLTLKGFKSFPDRTTLEFAEGVSVIVGPNGSGKSNVTEAVLWALGEQRPLAVRGQTMQDVIFSGGRGLPARGAAEVEVVLDNADGAAGNDFSELSIKRRLERSGDGEYQLNGARCRLVDVLETLSDTGLGKEMHSVVSQGRVESVIHSRPEDRRLLIEEAAGLGKHRKRRRRAELKLDRTGENLARALDVERDARSRLRPLKRQAEAAELHARLERQQLEAGLELARDEARRRSETLTAAESAAADAREARAAAEGRLGTVVARRRAAEEALAAHARRREALSERLFAATASADRIDVRLERARDAVTAAADAARRARRELDRIEAAGSEGSGGPEARAEQESSERVAALEAELAALAAARQRRVAEEVSDLDVRRGELADRRARFERSAEERRRAVEGARTRADAAQAAHRDAVRRLDSARSEESRVAGELAAIERFVRAQMPAPGGGRSLAEELRMTPGYELAVAAVLGPLLRAAIAPSLGAGESLLNGVGDDGGAVLLETEAATDGGARPPAPGAVPLADHVDASPAADALVSGLLRDAWVVPSLDSVEGDFRGVAVTRAGRALRPASGELRQAATSADRRALADLRRRDELSATAEAARIAVAEVEAALGPAAEEARTTGAARDEAEAALRAARSELVDATEEGRALDRAIERRAAVDDGPEAVRSAQLEGELTAERRIAERAERERAERHSAIARLRATIARQDATREAARRAEPALAAALEAVGAHRASLRERLDEDATAGAGTGAELRACAQEEAAVQASLRSAGEAVTESEVSAQRARDAAAELAADVEGLERRLGFEPGTGTDAPPLDEARRAELGARVERLTRRREQLGPVNPLAEAEYEEALAQVEELESQRADLEGALAELEGVVRETDRRIRESFERTFEATARNFEEVVEHLFPGGRGRLRLVTADTPRAVLGGGESDGSGADEPVEDGEAERRGDPGVEVEVTPAGKSTRRLSLLSGGEKSLVALAFLFAVFLARPCPFYVLDEVEAALDDLNIERFLRLVRSCADRAQFIVVTHQKRTMDVADRLYGVSMGSDGVSKVVSRKLAPAPDLGDAKPVSRPHAA